MDFEEDLNNFVEKAIIDDKFLVKLLNGILSNKDNKREKNFKILLKISKTHPKILYSKWNFLSDLLTSDNHFHRYMSINLLANLASVDIENKFKDTFKSYFGNLESDRTMVAGQTALNSGKIAKEITSLRPGITKLLLNIDKVHRGKQIELLKGYAIEAFNEYYIEIKEKERVINFVKKQLDSSSPKTKKTAKKFLIKWNIL